MQSSLVLDSVLGSGCFGTVHKGHDSVFPALAIKVIEKQSGESQADWIARRDDLLQEAHRLRDATHQNVVAVKYMVVAPTDDAIWLAMDYCAGGSLLSDYEGGPMKLSRVRRIINDVCNGLHVVHGRGMLHRDIKPGNILIDSHRYKIGDFGLVTNNLLYGYASGAGYITHLAPEVFANNLTSVATDIWALGMTVYRLLHGKDFVEQNIGTYGEAEIRAGNFASRLPWLSHIPSGWIKRIKKALHDDPLARFKDPVDMAQSFAHAESPLDWTCDYTPTQTRWFVPKGNRQLVVTYEVLSPRKHRWSAESVGTGKIKSIHKGGSHGLVNRSQAQKGLVEFFKTIG
jgi:serine/threonine protein kinase